MLRLFDGCSSTGRDSYGPTTAAALRGISGLPALCLSHGEGRFAFVKRGKVSKVV